MPRCSSAAARWASSPTSAPRPTRWATTSASSPTTCVLVSSLTRRSRSSARSSRAHWRPPRSPSSRCVSCTCSSPCPPPSSTAACATPTATSPSPPTSSRRCRPAASAAPASTRSCGSPASAPCPCSSPPPQGDRSFFVRDKGRLLSRLVQILLLAVVSYLVPFFGEVVNIYILSHSQSRLLHPTRRIRLRRHLHPDPRRHPLLRVQNHSHPEAENGSFCTRSRRLRPHGGGYLLLYCYAYSEYAWLVSLCLYDTSHDSRGYSAIHCVSHKTHFGNHELPRH